MIFKPSIFIRAIVLISFSLATILLVSGVIAVYGYKADLQIMAIPIFIILPFQLIFMGFLALMLIKTIERTDDEWIFRYKYRKRVVRLNKDSVKLITINRSIGSSKGHIGGVVFIRPNKGQRIIFTSMDFKQYSKLFALIEKDFEEKVTIRKGMFAK
ncbi:MAG: putative membrane protein [Crocinitomix sp.]|jgi:uncharacterized membrane protein